MRRLLLVPCAVLALSAADPGWARAQPPAEAKPARARAPAPPAAEPGEPAEAAEPAEPAEPDEEYGGHGFLDRVSKGTEEVDRCPPRSGVDERTLDDRMLDHYERGVVLYEQGDYEGAVGEFVTAYCDSPHPSMFYNIGQAYERMLDYEKAVAYLERFILASEPDAPNRKRAEIRVEVLRGLEARIQVATSPPGAEVTLSSDTGVTSRARADSDEPIKVSKGTYTMRVEAPGYQPIEQRVVAEIGRPYSYYFQLEPVKGAVRVVASPVEARIFLGDRLVGIGSYAETIPVGRYTLQVEAEGRPTEQRSFEVVAGRTTDLTVELAAKPRSGRWELVAASGLLLGSAGSTVAETLFDQEPGVASLAGLGGLAIGFGGAYLGVPSDLPVGTSSFIIGSSLIGAVEGAAIASLFVCDEEVVTELEEDGSETQRARLDCTGGADAMAGAAVATATVGAAFAAFSAPRFRLDGGDAAIINSGALWGVSSGLLFWSSFDRDPQIFGPMILAGLNLGVVVGATLAARAEVSRGRMALIDLAGLGGTVAGFAVGQAFDASSERLSHFTIVGLATGLIAGTFLTRSTGGRSTALRPGIGSTLSGDGLAFTLGAALH